MLAPVVVDSIGGNVTLGYRADGSGLTEVDDELHGALTEAGLDDILAFTLAGRAAARS